MLWCTDCIKSSDGEVFDRMRFAEPDGASVIQLNDALNEPYSMSDGGGSGSGSGGGSGSDGGGKVKDVIPIDAVWYIIMQYFEG